MNSTINCAKKIIHENPLFSLKRSTFTLKFNKTDFLKLVLCACFFIVNNILLQDQHDGYYNIFVAYLAKNIIIYHLILSG